MVDEQSAAGCSVQERQIRMEGSFYGYGLNITILNLSFGAFTRVQKNQDLETVEVKNYAFSYTFSY